MVIVLTFLVPLLAIAGVAVYLDRRDRHRGRTSGGWSLQNEALQSRIDVESVHAPPVQGGSMDWATYRRHDRARNAKKRPS